MKKILLGTFLFSLLSSLTISLIAQEDSLKYGTIKFDFNVDEAILILNNQFDDIKPIRNGDSIRVKTGLTSVKLAVLHDQLFEKQFTLDEDELVIVIHEFAHLPIDKTVLQNNYAAKYYFKANTLLITDEASNLSLNGTHIGTHFSFLDAKTGANRLTSSISTESGENFSTKEVLFPNSVYNFKIVENYVKPDLKESRKLSFIPGFSQNYKKENLKGSLIIIGISTAILSTSTFELSYRSNKRDFDSVLSDYRISTDPIETTQLGNELDDLNQKMERNTTIRNLSLFTALSIYGYNVIDGFFNKPKYGYREVKPIEFYLDANGLNELTGTLSFNF